MAEQELGEVFEVHGGGLDLLFPHHENELAQSRALGHEFARIWMHNGLLRFVGEKMSKSLGNTVSLRDALDEWGADAILLFFLGAHWRKPVDLAEETIEQARRQAQSFRDAFLGWEGEPAEVAPELVAALEDDFNTPAALALMHGWKDEGRLELVYPALELFGLARLTEPPVAPAEVVELAERRQAARGARDFAEADRLRAEIEALGWEARDVRDGFQLVPR
jgi:cysteinyl-tRNA synthetase